MWGGGEAGPREHTWLEALPWYVGVRLYDSPTYILRLTAAPASHTATQGLKHRKQTFGLSEMRSSSRNRHCRIYAHAEGL